MSYRAMRELLTVFWVCMVVSLLAAGLMTWIIERSAKEIQHAGLKGVAEKIWYGDSSPTPIPGK